MKARECELTGGHVWIVDPTRYPIVPKMEITPGPTEGLADACGPSFYERKRCRRCDLEICAVRRSGDA